MPSDNAQGSGLEVVIHFGAHKTATTFLQKFLKSEREEFRRNGVGYIPLDVNRASVMPFVSRMAKSSGPEDRPSAETLRRAITDALQPAGPAAPPIRRLLISDENLAGPSQPILNKGVLYPSAVYMLRILVDQFPGARIKLMLCTRDYADFIPSVYCELLRRHKLAPFSNILSSDRELALSWPMYLADVAAALPECVLEYWRYEDFSGSPADVVEAMTGIRLKSIDSAVAKTVRPSLTRKAVKILQAARKHLTVDEHKRLAACLVDHMKFEQDGKLTIEDPILAGDLREHYRRHTIELQAMSEPVTGIVRRIKR